jgi:hypothetical protein
MDGERPASGRFLEGRGGELFGFEVFCAVEASLESRATAVAMGEGSGIARLSFVPSPAFIAEYPKPASADPQMVNNLIRWLSTASPGRTGSVSNVRCVFLQGSSAFCTGLSPPPRSPRSDWKAIDSAPNRKTQGPTPMITARLAVPSDRSGRLLQRIKIRRHAGHNGVALAAPRKPRPNNA